MLMGNGVVDAAPAKPPPPAVVKLPAVKRFRPLKLVYGHDIRLAQMPVGCKFRELREVVRKRFPSSKPVLVKYRDSDGDLVTVTCTSELRLAESSVGKKDGEAAEEKDKLPVLRLHVVRIKSRLCRRKKKSGVWLMRMKVWLFPRLGYDSGGSHGVENEVMKSRLEEAEEEVAAPPKEKEGKDCDHAECKEVEIDDCCSASMMLGSTRMLTWTCMSSGWSCAPRHSRGDDDQRGGGTGAFRYGCCEVPGDSGSDFLQPGERAHVCCEKEDTAG